MSQETFPVFNFAPNWPDNEYKIGHGLCLVKCTGMTGEAFEKTLERSVLREHPLEQVKWGLVVDLPELPQGTRDTDLGVNLSEEVSRDVRRAFCLATALAGDRMAAVPFHWPFDAETNTFDVEFGNFWDAQDFAAIYAPCYSGRPEHQALTDTEGGTAFLRSVLDGVWRVRALDGWIDRLRLPETAGTLWRDGWRKEKEGRRSVDEWVASVQAALDPGTWTEEESAELRHDLIELQLDHMAPDVYHGHVAETLNQWRREDVELRGRIGAALTLYEPAMRQEGFPRLVGMCVVLETLFIIGYGNPGAQLARRIPQVIARCSESASRRKVAVRVSAIYNTRSALVHGRKDFQSDDTGIVRWADSVVKDSILAILTDPERTRTFLDKAGANEFLIDLDRRPVSTDP